MNKKPLIYIGGPYTRGDVALNVRSNLAVYMRLLDEGVVVPIAPLFTHFAHLMFPRDYEVWMSHDFDLINHCDAMLATKAEESSLGYVQAESSGMNREIAHCESIGVPVFYSVDDLYRHCAAIASRQAS